MISNITQDAPVSNEISPITPSESTADGDVSNQKLNENNLK
jgi:hypothetical protein